MTPAKVGRNNFCPCGSGNKFKYCHDLQLRQAIDPQPTYFVQPLLYALVQSALDDLKAVAPKEVIPDIEGRPRTFALTTATYYASMMHSAASAVALLIINGLVREGFGLRRKVTLCLLNIRYYTRFAPEAESLVNSEKIKRYRTLHWDKATEKQADEAKRRVNETLRIAPEAGEWKDGAIKASWNEPDDWQKEYRLKHNTMELPKNKPPEAKSMKSAINDLSSQELHATAFSIRNAISIASHGNVLSLRFDRAYKRGNYLLRDLVELLTQAVAVLESFTGATSGRSAQLRVELSRFPADDKGILDD